MQGGPLAYARHVDRSLTLTYVDRSLTFTYVDRSLTLNNIPRLSKAPTIALPP